MGEHQLDKLGVTGSSPVPPIEVLQTVATRLQETTRRRQLRALIVFVAFALSACGGTDERACALLGDIPDQVGDATLEEIRAVARAAQESEVSELRTLGDRLTLNLARGPALERLAAGAFLEVVQADLDALRRACGELETG